MGGRTVRSKTDEPGAVGPALCDQSPVTKEPLNTQIGVHDE